MAAPELLRQGLRDFAAGDVKAAARAWLAALEATPHDVQLRQFVEALKTVDPSLVAARLPMPPRQAGTLGAPWGESCATAPVTVRSEGPALALLQPQAPASSGRAVRAVELAELQARLKELWDLHDFTGCLEVAEAILRVAPGYAQALRARNVCRETLRQMYESKIGPLEAVPRQTIRADELPWLDLDQRAGFVLSQVDGVSTYADILEITGLDRLETLRILAKLASKSVIGVGAER